MASVSEDERARSVAIGHMTARLANAAYRGACRILPRAGRYTIDGVVAPLTGHPYLLRHADLTVGLLRRRLAPGRLFVGWVLHGDEDNGSTRVHALLPHAYLRSIGVNSVILRKPREHCAPLWLRRDDVERLLGARLDVVVFQGVSARAAAALAEELRAGGTKTVFVTGDLFGQDMAKAVDWVVAASQGLTAVAGTHSQKTSVIESVVDAPPGLVKDYDRIPAHDRIRLVWVGYPENLPLLDPVRDALQDPRLSQFEMITISRGLGATYQWHRRRVFGDLLTCDIGVLPLADTDRYRAKPNTRMTMLKALGIPMVASPIDSYARTLTHGRSCYFARTTAEWVEALLCLADPDRRRAVGLADREAILATYGLEAIGQRWLHLFRNLAPGRA
jgi:glycosyltransferase involved in cell wall biosynthesis